MVEKWVCPFERIREYPDCFQDCPDTSECKMKDSWKQIRPLPKLKESVSFPIDIKHPQVIAFAKAMDEVLCENDHKGGWRDCDIEYLRHRLIEEVGEYFALLSCSKEAWSREKDKKELLDVANFVLMLWGRS